MPTQSLFTSESVSEGHPDKVADQVSDAVVDAMLAQDSESRVACETMIKTGIVMLAGEIRSEAVVDFDKLARSVIEQSGLPPRARLGEGDVLVALSRLVTL